MAACWPASRRSQAALFITTIDGTKKKSPRLITGATKRETCRRGPSGSSAQGTRASNTVTPGCFAAAGDCEVATSSSSRQCRLSSVSAKTLALSIELSSGGDDRNSNHNDQQNSNENQNSHNDNSNDDENTSNENHNGNGNENRNGNGNKNENENENGH